MSSNYQQASTVRTFQSSAAVVKMTGVDEDCSDSSDEEDVRIDADVIKQSAAQNRSEQDSPNWATTSWKCDSGFNSDVNNGTTGDSEGSNEHSDIHTDEQPLHRYQQNSRTNSNITASSVRESPQDVVLIPPGPMQNNVPDKEAEFPIQSKIKTDSNLEKNPFFDSEKIQSSANVEQNNSNFQSRYDKSTEQTEELDKSKLLDSPESHNIQREAGESSARHNPFDRVPFLEEDHFDQSSRQHVSPARSTTTDSNHVKEEPQQQLYFGDGMDDYHWDEDEEDLNFLKVISESFSMQEDYFSQPEGFFGYSKTEELELAIRKCKDRIVASRHPERHQEMVDKLVQLRMKLHELKNTSEEDIEGKKILGHKFERYNGKALTSKCEVCASSMWSRIRSTYICQACGFTCHSKCLDVVKRHCVSFKLAESGSYEIDICPEQGLAAQNYRCADCRTSISFTDSSEPRQCDYSGLYYCQLCHWNDLEVIPARVIHNWDFKPRKVCRQSKQLLDLMRHKITIPVQQLNPSLFNYVDELGQIKKLREEILMMKMYFLSCRIAKEVKLLKQLHERPHFVENAVNYSLQDLIDTQDESLMQYLGLIHNLFAQHIRQECQVCQVKGFICEFCQSDEILYPFDLIAITCSKCSTVFHRDCFYKKEDQCPKCVRIARVSSSPSGVR